MLKKAGEFRQPLKFMLGILMSIVLLMSGSALAGGPEVLQKHWQLYFGGFGGYYQTMTEYESLYSSATTPRVLLFNNSIRGRGLSWGGDIGVRYQFLRPCWVGLEFSGMGNSKKARFDGEFFVFPGNVTPLLVNTTLAMESNFDLAGMLGMNIASVLNVYLKAGVSRAQLSQNYSISDVFSLTVFQQKAHYHLWGAVLGLGFTREVYKGINVFGEYDFYDYGNQSLISANNVPLGSQSGVAPGTFTQNAMNIKCYTVRAGVNIAFAI